MCRSERYSRVPYPTLLPVLRGKILPHLTKLGTVNVWSRIADVLRTAAPKQEQFFFGGTLMISWFMNAASFTGYGLLAIFISVAVARLAKHRCLALAARLPRRSQARHYLVTWVSAAFFSLLTARACYLSTLIVDSQFRSDPFEMNTAPK
jgi:hypothetical protein